MVLLLPKLVPALAVVTCVLASLSWADTRSSLLGIGHAEASPRTIGPYEGVSVQAFYDFFSSRYTILRFVLINVSQYMFITIGWIITATMWSLIKGEDLSKISIDANSIGEFLVSPQKGFSNIGIGVGSALFAVGGWTLLSSIGPGLSSARVDKNSERSNPELLSEPFYPAVDATFGWQGIAKQTAINTVLVISFVTFWLFCSWLPVSESASRRSFPESEGSGTWSSSQEEIWRQKNVIDSIEKASHLYV